MMKERENGRKREGGKEREREREKIVVSGDIGHIGNTLWTLVRSGVQARGWEPGCPAIFVLPFLPSDVMLLVSQELGRDKREARGYAAALPLYRALHILSRCHHVEVQQVSTYSHINTWFYLLTFMCRSTKTYRTVESHKYTICTRGLKLKLHGARLLCPSGAPWRPHTKKKSFKLQLYTHAHSIYFDKLHRKQLSTPLDTAPSQLLLYV